MDIKFISMLLEDAETRGDLDPAILQNCHEIAITGLQHSNGTRRRVPPAHGNCHVYAKIAYKGFVFLGSFSRTDYAFETVELIAREASPFAAITVEGRK